MFKRITVLLLIVIFSMSGLGMTYAEEKNFSDVKDSDWYYDAVKTLAESGIISGYDDGSFKPLENVNRDAFATMMVKTLDLSLEKPSKAWFEDVEKNHWAYKYVETSKYYMTGYVSNGAYYFRPEDNAVREDMAVALVKALKYDINGNSEYLEKFVDADDISTNLKEYVATAVKHGLMSGSPVDGGFKFSPQSDLTRAETAALLMNLIKTEKIVVSDEEKVTFDLDEPASEKNEDKENKDDKKDSDIDPSEKLAQIEAIVKDDHIVLEWSKPSSVGFKGYKVVASQSDSSPKYPENGSLKYITDYGTRRIEIKPYTGYNNGDFSSFKPGEKYYFSITTFYEDGNYFGRTEDAVMPGEEVEIGEYITPKVEAYAEKGKIVLKWDQIDHPLFDGYKVVASQNDSQPIYPENGYLQWIPDKYKTSTEIWTGNEYYEGDFSKFNPGEKVYVSVTAVYKDKKIAGNAVRIEVPDYD